jgi:tetratricopeptide (TPR) repeat protein
MMDDIDESVSRWAGVIPAEDPHAAYLEAESLYGQGARDEAIPRLRASIAARPSFVPAHYLLGLCSRATGELDEAEAAFQETIRLDDSHLRAYANLARVLIDADRPADARETIQAALELGLESDGLYNVLGLAHMDEENGVLADEAFTAAIDLNPENLYALNNLGLLRIRQGRYEDAVDPLTEASQLDGAPAYVFNNLGMALERSDRLAESVDALATARDAGHAGAAASYERVRATFDHQLAQLAREATRSGIEGDVAAETSIEEPAPAPERPVVEAR